MNAMKILRLDQASDIRVALHTARFRAQRGPYSLWHLGRGFYQAGEPRESLVGRGWSLVRARHSLIDSKRPVLSRLMKKCSADARFRLRHSENACMVDSSSQLKGVCGERMSEKYHGTPYVDQRHEDALRTLFGTFPTRFEDRYVTLLVLRRMVHDAIAGAAQPLIDEYVKRLRAASYEERRTLTLDLLQDVRSLGLNVAVSSPQEQGGVLNTVEPRSPTDPPQGTFIFTPLDRFGGAGEPIPFNDVPELHAVREPFPKLNSFARSFTTKPPGARGR